MEIDRFTHRRPGNDQREALARKVAISRLQRLTGTSNIDYNEPSSHYDPPSDKMPRAGTSKPSSVQKAGA